MLTRTISISNFRFWKSKGWVVESFYQYAEQRLFGTVGGVAVVSTDEPVADLVESIEVV